jgi:hypothetical protein
MPSLILSPAIFDLRIPRMNPCSAKVSPVVECGATPSSLYRVYCLVPSHEREVWLCPVHAAISACGGSICRVCADNGGIGIARLYRVSELVRITGHSVIRRVGATVTHE